MLRCTADVHPPYIKKRDAQKHYRMFKKTARKSKAGRRAPLALQAECAETEIPQQQLAYTPQTWNAWEAFDASPSCQSLHWQLQELGSWHDPCDISERGTPMIEMG